MSEICPACGNISVAAETMEAAVKITEQNKKYREAMDKALDEIPFSVCCSHFERPKDCECARGILLKALEDGDEDKVSR